LRSTTGQIGKGRH